MIAHSRREGEPPSVGQLRVQLPLETEQDVPLAAPVIGQVTGRVLHHAHAQRIEVLGEDVFERFELDKPGTMSPAEYDKAMRDLVNFMVYLAEPAKLVRYRIGVYVLIFLAVFMMPFYYGSRARSVPEYLKLRFDIWP